MDSWGQDEIRVAMDRIFDRCFLRAVFRQLFESRK